MSEDRITKLARNLDRVAEKDLSRLVREKEIEELRRQAAVQLHERCRSLVRTINEKVRIVRLELSPVEFNAADFHETGANLIQLNAAGRVVQLSFRGTEPFVSSYEMKTPYTLEGSIHWFNQEMLERDEMKEHLLFFCLDRKANEWRYYDTRTHRTGAVDEGYLISLLEQII
ncbi:MAG: hypothetical protein JJE04_25385 [Acidobacteriia bacterium]|nr:hypothetical protein [Terriglobia bacterium]